MGRQCRLAELGARCPANGHSHSCGGEGEGHQETDRRGGSLERRLPILPRQVSSRDAVGRHRSVPVLSGTCPEKIACHADLKAALKKRASEHPRSRTSEMGHSRSWRTHPGTSGPEGRIQQVIATPLIFLDEEVAHGDLTDTFYGAAES